MCSPIPLCVVFFFFNDTATTEIYTLSLHDALPISFLYRTGVTVSHHRVSRAQGTPGVPAKIGEGPATTLGRLEVLGQALAHEQPRAVHARLHRRQADAKRLGDVGVRHALDVVQGQRGPVVHRQRVDRGGQDLAQLAL